MRLYGLRGMPKPETRLSIDFSALLGPVFFLWLLQMLLPVCRDRPSTNTDTQWMSTRYMYII